MTDQTTQAEPEGPMIFAHVEAAPGGPLLEQVRELVEGYMRPEPVHVVDPVSGIEVPAIITREGVQAIPAYVFDEYLEAPRFRHGKATMTSLDSFIKHVLRFRSADTAIFACDDRARPSLTAVLDYHRAGAENPPSHGNHRTTFAFPLSDEWKAWHEADGSKMTMADFAAFLEDRIVDVDDPDSDMSADMEKLVSKLGGRSMIASPSALMDLSRGLAVHEASTVREAVKLSSGEGEVVFQSEHTDTAGNRLTVPTMFLLAIPVFRKGDPYQVLARLRYRKTAGGLVFWFELSRTDLVFDHAFDEAVERVENETSAPVFRGSPEA